MTASVVDDETAVLILRNRHDPAEPTGERPRESCSERGPVWLRTEAPRDMDAEIDRAYHEGDTAEEKAKRAQQGTEGGQAQPQSA